MSKFLCNKTAFFVAREDVNNVKLAAAAFFKQSANTTLFISFNFECGTSCLSFNAKHGRLNWRNATDCLQTYMRFLKSSPMYVMYS